MRRRYFFLGLWFAFMAGFPVVKGQDNSTSVRVTDRNNDTSTRVLGQNNDTSRVLGQDDNNSTDEDPLPCGSPPPLEHGSFTVHNKGMLVLYRCTVPHILYGSNQRRCKSNGQWGGNTPICSGYGCPESQAPLVPNAIVNRYNGGTVRVYECHEEYRSEGPGNPTMYCNGTHWRNQPPRCVLKEGVASLDTCPPPPIVEKASMMKNPDGLVKYTCVRGYYQRLGTKSIRCGPGGQWIGRPAVCTRPGCVVLDIMNGMVFTNGIRTVAKIKCNDGYQLKGSPLLFCNGRNWNGSLPICEAQRQNGGYPAVVRDGRSCAYRIPTIQNGRYDYADKSDSNGQLFYAVVYSCNTGYVMHPANHVVYCSSGNVVGTPPNCISTCGHSKGGCWHNCRNVEGEGAVCSCRDGYQLGSDGKSCHDINECSANQGRGPCQNACANSYGSFSCYCLTGYTLADDGTSCLRNRGTCDCGPNGRCIRRTGYESECQCFNGYRRSDDDRLHCLDIDECVESGDGRADCQGACRNTPGSYRCFCPESWQQLGRNGRTCKERPCSCGHGSIACSQPNGRRICTCSEGYKPTPDGTRCVDHNECEETDPCQGECINTQGSYHCRCRESGYQLAADRHSCEDINECRNSQLNNCQHACVNEPGSFHCDCPPGHILMPDGISCKECRANSYRSSIANECVECPAHSHTIGNLKASIGDCVCLPGFSGALLRDQPCKDIDECERDNGGCKQHCINTPGSFYCACPDGYSLLDDGKTCTDRDECAQSNGGCQHNCVNTEGSFSCSCNEGYAVDPTDPYSCIDVNECETPDHGCEQFCVNFHGGFYCQCDDNSIRAPDGKTCKAITCSPLEIPEKMKLSPRERCIGMRGANQITVGTTCRMSCQRGYELVGESNRTCLNTGRWSGEMPACRFVRCAALEPPEHGQVRPDSCLLDNEVQFKRACAFTCDQGYRLIGPAFRNCQANGTWSNEKPRCEEISEITCPRDISTVLQPGASSAVIDLPRPAHTLARLESSVPLAGHAFPAGRTTVTYMAQSNTTDSAVSCSFHVIVEDKESPVFTFCPESFTVHTDEQYPSITWEAPLVTDNVAVVENITWISPESRFTWGTYTVLTDVRDAAGNSASCKFSISIRTIDCGEPIGPVNGDSGCSDWMFGRICEPTCNQLHYFFDGPPNDLYLCGFNGEWSPSSEVPDCSPYSALGDESMCLLGTVLKTFPAIEGPVCIACPRGTFWAVVMENEASCLPCNQETYQDEFGMDSCKRCPSGHVTEAEGAKTSNQCKPVEDLQTIYNGVGGANRRGSD